MYHSQIQSYPNLTPSEFAEAAHHLDSLYSRATLGPLRRQWKLRVRSALNTHFVSPSDPEYSTFVQITRPLEVDLDDDGLSDFLDGLSFDGPGTGPVVRDEGMGMGGFGGDSGMEVEDDDEVCFLLSGWYERGVKGCEVSRSKGNEKLI